MRTRWGAGLALGVVLLGGGIVSANHGWRVTTRQTQLPSGQEMHAVIFMPAGLTDHYYADVVNLRTGNLSRGAYYLWESQRSQRVSWSITGCSSCGDRIGDWLRIRVKDKRTGSTPDVDLQDVELCRSRDFQLINPTQTPVGGVNQLLDWVC